MKTNLTSTILFIVIAFVCLFEACDCRTIRDTNATTKCEKRWWQIFFSCPDSTSSSDNDDSIMRPNETEPSLEVTEEPTEIKQNGTDQNLNQSFFEGDMILNDTSAIEASAVYSDKKWPNAIIPFEVSDEYTSHEKLVILNAMSDFQTKSCIKFTPRNNEEDYIYIWKKPNTGCASHIGRRGGKQEVSLNNGCVNPTTVKHELMHAIGFVHEQSRSDRDDFVTIHWNNVIPEQRYKFNKYDISAVQMLRTPYDIKSIMHYPWNMLAVDDTKPTITTKDGVTNIVPSDDFTEADILDVSRLYNCNPDDCWDSPECNKQEKYHWQDGGNGQVQWAFNCEFAGHDIDKKLSSGEECGGLCIANLDCTHFSWGSDSYCYIKSAPKTADIYQLQGAVCGYIIRRDPQFQWRDGNNGLLNWAHGCDFYGNEIGHVKSHGEACGGLCLADPKCTHFSWGWEGNCYLKTATKNAVANAIAWDGICGWVNARLIDGDNIDWKEGKNGGFLWQDNCNFVAGNVRDIVVVDSAKDDCGIKCQERSECSHFTWNGKCILKRAPASENFSYLNNAICGKLLTLKHKS